MAWFSGIISGAKKLYRKADVAVGGYLPGGQTPTEVSAARAPKPTPSPTRARGAAPTTPFAGPTRPGIDVEKFRATGVSNYDPTINIYTDPSGQKMCMAPEYVPEGTQIGGTPQKYGVGGKEWRVAQSAGMSREEYRAQLDPSAQALITAGDYFSTAFTHPFKTLGAAIDPNRGVSEIVNKQFAKPLGAKLADTAIATTTYATSIITANALITRLTSTGTSIAAGNIVAGETAKAAAGQTAKQVAGQAAVNTATTATRASIATKALSVFKNPTFVMGTIATWVFSGSFAGNEMGDAAMSLSIAIRDAEKSGDIETARELKEYSDDLNMDKLMKYLPFLGPIGYIKATRMKTEAAQKVIEESMNRAEENEIKDSLNKALEEKIRAGLATQREVQQYVLDNPYTMLTDSIKGAAKSAQYQEQALYTQQLIENIKNQGAQYRAGLYGAGAGAAQEWQPPSSLRFGLLHTAGGYEATGAGVVTGEPDTYTVTGDVDKDQIAQYLFGIPYAKLTDEQKAVVDKW